MKKRIIAIILTVVMAVMISGCKKQNDFISPTQLEVKTNVSGIPLYFAYKNQPYLCAEFREVKGTNENATIEETAINELIKGPANTSELSALIPKNTKVKVEGISDTLFVTLSQEFFDTLPSENKNWQSSEIDANTVLSRRKMSIYSIVNTVTEIGNYQRVQILIEENQSTYRPNLYTVGFSSKNENKFLDALSHTPEVNLTPQNTVSNALSLIQEKQWQQLYKCQSQKNQEGTVTAYEFEDFASKSSIIIENFSINNNVTYNANGTAIVNINFTIRQSNTTTEYTQFPVKLVLKDNIWKIDYTSIKKIIEKSK